MVFVFHLLKLYQSSSVPCGVRLARTDILEKKTFEYRLLPEPRLNITIDFGSIIQAFQDLRYIGELRQRWNEIKKLQSTLPINLAY